jgi:plastocyanin domain-containing protein
MKQGAKWIAIAVLWGVGCSKSEAAQPSGPEPVIPPAADGVQQTKVIVDDKGFTPSDIKAEKGKPLSLVFIRTTEGTCAKQVVFPELKLEKELPLNVPVSLTIPTDDARRLTFQCGMGMYKSAVVIH